jgi:WD40 repeat protein/uncharacterized caspase-like protein
MSLASRSGEPLLSWPNPPENDPIHLKPIKMRQLIVCLIALLPFQSFAQQPGFSLNLGHTGPVTGLTFSPNGEYLVSSAEDNTMKVWDVQGGHLLETSPVNPYPPFARHLFFFPEQELVTYQNSGALSNWFTWTWNLRDNQLSDRRDMMPRPMDESFSLSLDGLELADEPPGRDYTAELNEAVKSDFSASGEFIYFTSGIGLQHNGLCRDGQRYYKRRGDTLVFRNIWAPLDSTVMVYPGLTTVFSHSSGGRFLMGSPDGPSGKDFTIWPIDGKGAPFSITVPAGYLLADISSDGTKALLFHESGKVALFDLQEQQLEELPVGLSRVKLHKEVPRPEIIIYNQASFSTDGRLLALGGEDGVIYLYDYERGVLIRKLQGYTSGIKQVAFSPNGEALQFVFDQLPARTWDLKNRLVKAGSDLSSEPIVSYEAPEIGGTPDGRMAVVISEDNQLELWDKETGERVQVIGDPELITKPGNKIAGAVLSPDRKRLYLSTYLVAKRDAATNILWDLENNQKVADIRVSVNKGVSASVFSPDGRYLLLGHRSGEISVYDQRTGEDLLTLNGHENSIRGFAINPANTNQFLAFDENQDGKAILWDISKKASIATLFNLGTEDWVVTMPGGLFDASPAAMKLIFYKVEEQSETEIIELEQLKSRYYEPGLLQKLLGHSTERLRPVEDLAALPLFPKSELRIEKDELQITLSERSGGIGAVAIAVNGKEVAADANPDRATRLVFDLKPVQSYLFRHPDSINIVSIRAFNEAGWLKSAAKGLEYEPASWARGSGQGPADWVGTLDPKMFVVCIGTSDYSGTSLDLKYATQDANAMAKALQYAGANLFANGDSIEVYALTTTQETFPAVNGTTIKWQFADKANIKATLKAIQNKAKAEDIVLIYLSGHGVTYGIGEESQFYYLTASVSDEGMISDQQVREAYTVSSGELTAWINAIPALKQVLVVDACNSGKVVEELTGTARNLNSSQIRAFDRMKDRTGMFVLSGSAADKVSYEASEYGQGLLTYALLQGMMGVDARRTDEGHYVDVMRLFQHARNEVPKLAASIQGIQTPMLGFPSTGASFDIGIVKDQRNIPIGQKKPVFTRPIFLNSNTLDDDLKLMPLLENALEREFEKGMNADFVYVPASDYPAAYSVKGQYAVEDGRITLTAKLFGGTEPVSLDIPPMEDPKQLIKTVVREVKKALRNL